MNSSNRSGGRAGERLCSLVVAAGIALFSIGISAQEGPDQPSKEVTAKVLDLIREANQDYANGDYKSAAKGYRKAYSLYPDPAFQYRLGLTAEKRGQLRAALKHYQNFLEDSPEDETTQRVKSRIPQLKAEIPPRVVVRTQPAGAEVRLGSLGSEVLGKTPTELDLLTGSNRIYITLEGYQLVQRELDLGGGEEEVIDISLQNLRAGGNGDPLLSVDEEVDAGEEDSSLATWGWIGAGTGGVLLATGGVFSFLNQTKTDEVNDFDKQAPGATRAQLQELKDEANTYYDISVAAYIAGGVITATGVGLLLVEFMSEDDGNQAFRFELSPTEDGAKVGLSGSF